MFWRLRVAIHWEAQMRIIAAEQDNSVDEPTLETWWQELEAWHANSNYKPDLFQEPLLGVYSRCPKPIKLLSKGRI
jgi:hypothetical protein